MNKIFKNLGNRQVIDLIPHIKSKLTDDVKIYVGTDSQNFKDETHYATVIILHYGNKGGHVVYSKEIFPKIRDTFERLWKEVDHSVQVALYLQENGLPKIDHIDLDFNADPKYHSNTVLRAALGYVTSYGFVPRIKPQAAAATCCADHILH